MHSLIQPPPPHPPNTYPINPQHPNCQTTNLSLPINIPNLTLTSLRSFTPSPASMKDPLPGSRTYLHCTSMYGDWYAVVRGRCIGLIAIDGDTHQGSIDGYVDVVLASHILAILVRLGHSLVALNLRYLTFPHVSRGDSFVCGEDMRAPEKTCSRRRRGERLRRIRSWPSVRCVPCSGRQPVQ
jgi:hypothetical protein